MIPDVISAGDHGEYEVLSPSLVTAMSYISSISGPIFVSVEAEVPSLHLCWACSTVLHGTKLKRYFGNVMPGILLEKHSVRPSSKQDLWTETARTRTILAHILLTRPSDLSKVTTSLTPRFPSQIVAGVMLPI